MADCFAEVTSSDIDGYLDKYYVIVCKLRNSRVKAKQAAVLEMIFSQFDNEILAIINGPLGDIKGIISFFCPKKNLDLFKEKLFGIGYCRKFYLLDFENETGNNQTDLKSINPLVWKKRHFSVKDFFCQDNRIYEEQSPHRRQFKITGSDGIVKTVFGYRGDGSDIGRRSLPVEDARCMVNLSIPCRNKRALDPFVGAGGIVYEFKYIVHSGKITSIDMDYVLKPGLEFLGADHYVMNAADMSFPPDSFDSVVTETPFSENAADDIAEVFKKVNACISKDGFLVIMCGKNQAEKIFNITGLENYLLFTQDIDRKGTDVVISVWCRNRLFFNYMENTIKALKKIY